MYKNQFIAVVGFSRSGTSLISRILAEVLNIDFGEAIEHIPKNAENPDGFFENQQILAFNESMLARSNASVTNLPAVDFLQHLPAGELDSLVAQAKNLLTVVANTRATFGFKDPRLCLTLPIWRLAAKNLKTVIIVRSPWSALQSFSAQMHRPLHELEPLWFEYQHRILLNTAGGDRYMLSFERLLSHPLETVTSVAAYLGIEPNLAKWDKQLAAIVKPGRVTNLKPAEPFEYSPHFQPKTKLAYATLNTFLAAGAQPDYAVIGSLFQGLRGYEAAHVQPMAATVTKLDGELREQINHVIARDIALVEHAKMIRDRDTRIALLDTQLQEHSGLLATQISLVQARDQTIGLLEGQLQDHSSQLALQLDGELREQINHVIARDIALVEHAKMIRDRDTRIALLDTQLQEHSGLLATQISLVQARDQTIGLLEGQLQDHSSQLAAQIASVQICDQTIRSLETQLHEHSDLLAAHIFMVTERDKKIIGLEQSALNLQQLQSATITQLATFQSQTSELTAHSNGLRAQLAQAQGLTKTAQANAVMAAENAAKSLLDANAAKREQVTLIEGTQHLGREVVALATTIDELKSESRDLVRKQTNLIATHRIELQQETARLQMTTAQADSAHLAAENGLRAELAAVQHALLTDLARVQHALQTELSTNQEQLTLAHNKLEEQDLLHRATMLVAHNKLEEQDLLHRATMLVARKKELLLTSRSQTPIYRLKQIISPPTDLWNLVALSYATFKTEPQTSMARQRGLALYVADPISDNDATVYELSPELRDVSEIQFVLDDDIRVAGELHLELLSPKHVVIAQSHVLLTAIGSDGVARFVFPVISLAGNAAEHLTLRLFTKHAPDPVRLYEMQQRAKISQKVRVRCAFIRASLTQ